MKRDLTQIPLPTGVFTFIDKVVSLGFCLALVGGTNRDYLISGYIGNDFDFELSLPVSLPETEWLEKVHQLKVELSLGYEKVSITPKFYVIKIEMDDYSLELAPARLEQFEGDIDKLNHRDVHLSFPSNMTAAESFKRRDFTFNAIGLLFEQGEVGAPIVTVLDPFFGVDDINSKTMKACSKDFSCDPVRYLRAIRFSLKLNFTFSQELELLLKAMSLKNITTYYYLYEGLKVNFFAFNKLMFSLVERYNTSLNDRIEQCRFLCRYEQEVHNKSEDIVVYLLKEREDIKNIEYLASLFQMKKKRLKSLLKENRY
jgi:hypothetical protein